jgi:hypothetical protein
MFNYNAMLCVYYACAIAFTMRESNIKRYVEPFLHGLPILAGLSFSVPPLFYDMYNPGISVYAWCGPVTYPNECSVYEDVECIRGNPRMIKVIRILISVFILYVFCIIFISLGMVIWKVIQTDQMIEQISKLYDKRGHKDMTKVLEKHRNTKAVVIQAFSYILAFLLGVIPPLLLSVGAVDTSGKGQIETADIFEKLTLIFLPLQGFFNFIIFVSFKVYNYRRVRRDVSISRVIAILFCSSAHDPCFISRISFVMKNEDDRVNDVEDEGGKQHPLYYDVDVKDESNDELRYRLGLLNHKDEASVDSIFCSEVCHAEKGHSNEGLVLGNIPSDDNSPREPDVSEITSESGDEQSCNNPSSLFSFPSKISSTNSSLWQRNLSVEENSVIESKAKRTYYDLK